MNRKYTIKVKRDFGRYGYWNPKTRKNEFTGFVVCNGNGFMNLTPGAGWYKTIETAFLGIEALEISEKTGKNFYKIYRDLSRELELRKINPDLTEIFEDKVSEFSKTARVCRTYEY